MKAFLATLLGNAMAIEQQIILFDDIIYLGDNFDSTCKVSSNFIVPWNNELGTVSAF